MKVFYCFVRTEIPEHHRFGDVKGRYYGKIKDVLVQNGHEVDEFSYTISSAENDGANESWKVNAVDVLTRVQKADVFVAEMSFASQTLGFLLGMAVVKGKPSLYLFQPGYSGKPGSPLYDNPSRLLTIRSYNDDASLEQTLNRFVRKAQKQLRSDRTAFVTTRYINDYLNWKTKKTGLSKGEVIRGILENAIEGNPEYTNSD